MYERLTHSSHVRATLPDEKKKKRSPPARRVRFFHNPMTHVYAMQQRRARAGRYDFLCNQI